MKTTQNDLNEIIIKQMHDETQKNLKKRYNELIIDYPNRYFGIDSVNYINEGNIDKLFIFVITDDEYNKYNSTEIKKCLDSLKLDLLDNHSTSDELGNDATIMYCMLKSNN